MTSVTTVSLVGVGGQGILLGAAILAETAAAQGLDVKASEVKGMAQRGGSVLSTVRFGPQVWSPVAPRADVVIATELLEGRRGLALLEAGGTLVCAVTTRIMPGSVLRGEQLYPGAAGAARRRRGVGRAPAGGRRRGRGPRGGLARAPSTWRCWAPPPPCCPSPTTPGRVVWPPPCRPRSSKSTSARSPWAGQPSARRSGSEGQAAHRVS